MKKRKPTNLVTVVLILGVWIEVNIVYSRVKEREQQSWIELLASDIELYLEKDSSVSPPIRRHGDSICVYRFLSQFY